MNLGPRRIAVVGSREGINKKAVHDFIDRLDEGTVVVSGGAKGVDTWAAERARERGLEVVEIRPNWKKYGRGAGFRRNTEIVLAAHDVAAFWNGISRGTMDTVKKAVKYVKNVALFDADGNVISYHEGILAPEIRRIPRAVARA